VRVLDSEHCGKAKQAREDLQILSKIYTFHLNWPDGKEYAGVSDCMSNLIHIILFSGVFKLAFFKISFESFNPKCYSL